MEKEFGTDPDKMLVWDKTLGEQSEFVKKAIEPLLTWEFIDNDYNLNKNYDKTYLKDMYTHDKNGLVFQNCEVVDIFNHLSVDNSFRGDELPVVEKLKSLGIEGCIRHDRTDVYNDEYLKELNVIHEKDSPVSGRQLETAQKTGYVQGVCESVLAFNTDDNRKIMSESAMSFLSKKILSEMNVTKDMAQKFANPETYKALEQCVFAPAREQQLEQQQSQGIGR